MARAQIREVTRPDDLRVIAAPVDSYVRPATPTRSSLHDIAEGLSALDAGLGVYMSKQREEEDEAAKQKAIADAQRDDAPFYDEGTKRGLIPPQSSPTYMKWYNRTKGETIGRKLTDKFQLAYEQWDGKNSGDPEAYNKFVTDFVRENVAEDLDPQVLAGLNPYVDNLLNNGYAQFTKDRAEHIKRDSLAHSGAVTADDLRREGRAAKSEGRDLDLETTWAQIMVNREEAIKRVNADDYDDYVVAVILEQAEEQLDEDYLKLLDNTMPGKSYTLSSDPAVRAKLNAARDRIQAKQAAQVTDMAQLQEKQDKANHEAELAKVSRILAEDPYADIPEESLKVLERRDGDIRTKIAGMRKTFADSEVLEDPAAMARVFADIHSGTLTEKGIVDLFQKGTIRTRETYLAAMDRLDKVNKSRSEGTGILSDPAAERYKKMFLERTGTADGGMFAGKDISDDTLKATVAFEEMLLDWEIQNPGANKFERYKAINEMGKAVLEDITSSNITPGAYTPDTTQPQATVPIPEVAPEAPTSPAPEEGQPGDGARSLYEGVTDWLGSWFGADASETAIEGQGGPSASDEATTPTVTLEAVPEKIRPAVEALAKRRGISNEEAATQYMKALEELRGGPAPQDVEEQNPGIDPGITNSIPEEDRTKLESLLRNPPRSVQASNVPVAPLLNLIGGTEGTDKGDGYNETLGYGAFTGGDVDLTSMTLDEVDALQTEMLRHPDNKWNSSAVGRYQIVRKTLRQLRTDLGLTGTELYDRNMQDRLAMALLERRGLSKWRNGEMTDEEFMNGLSAEWASLPKADGKGTYKGQRVGASADRVRGTLAGLRDGEVQVASLDPSAGFPKDIPAAYAKIPATDDRGEDQIAKFMEWNPDPIGNHEQNLSELEPRLQDVVRLAQSKAKTKFVVASGKRDSEKQKKAVEWGWSKTEHSDHLHGDAVDLWPVDEDGAVVFEKGRQKQIMEAMKAAAKELGYDLDVGGDWKSFKDLPHFAIKKGKKA